MSTEPEVIIVGGGLAGLAAARTLTAQGIPTMLLEASAELGGRVATDEVEGFLLDRGFSKRAVEGFFRPFFGGVFLDARLDAPEHWFEFLFAMFASGRATLPAAGMRAVPRQLASGLPAGTVRLSSEVRLARAGRVELKSGETFAPRAVILATDAHTVSTLVHGSFSPVWGGCVTLYYAATTTPVGEPLLVLNGRPGTGPVNHVCVPSDVAPGYAPAGAHLVSATIIGSPSLDDATLDRDARAQLAGWFGASALRSWRLLRASRVTHALPRIAVGASAVGASVVGASAVGASADRAVRLDDRLYACGDHLESPSINGALRSGRRAAEALLADWASRSNAIA